MCPDASSQRTYDTPPRATYDPNPEYSDASRRERVSGSVTLAVQVGADGAVHDVCVKRSFRPDLDANAVAAVRTWKFFPAKKDGAAVPAAIMVEVHFKVN